MKYNFNYFCIHFKPDHSNQDQQSEIEYNQTTQHSTNVVCITTNTDLTIAKPIESTNLTDNYLSLDQNNLKIENKDVQELDQIEINKNLKLNLHQYYQNPNLYKSQSDQIPNYAHAFNTSSSVYSNIHNIQKSDPNT